jgi:hypothetical protein
MLKKIVVILVVIIAVFAGILYFKQNQSQPDRYDGFAKCLKDKGAIFYGTSWCPHCQNQKAAFGRSKQYLPYVECSTPDGRQQTEVCKQAEIISYPTWVFPDGSKQTGEISMQDLAQKTGCTLPAQ